LRVSPHFCFAIATFNLKSKGEEMKRNRLPDSEADGQANERNKETAQPSASSLEAPTKAKNLRTFPHRLYSLLNDKQYENAIKWSSDGKSFG
jgi:hypothetical protein